MYDGFFYEFDFKKKLKYIKLTSVQLFEFFSFF